MAMPKETRKQMRQFDSDYKINAVKMVDKMKSSGFDVRDALLHVSKNLNVGTQNLETWYLKFHHFGESSLSRPKATEKITPYKALEARVLRLEKFMKIDENYIS